MATVELHELKAYQLAMRVGEDVWSLINGWEWLAQQTVGLQWVRSADLIAANVSEGCERSSATEAARFYCNALGALRQTQTWLEKAAERRLVVESAARELSLKLDSLRRQLQASIDSFEHNPSDAAHETSRDGSIHLLPLEAFFHPRPSAWKN